MLIDAALGKMITALCVADKFYIPDFFPTMAWNREEYIDNFRIELSPSAAFHFTDRGGPRNSDSVIRWTAAD